MSDDPSLKGNVAAKIATNGQRKVVKPRTTVLRRIALLCQSFTSNSYFWIAVALFAMFEPILCSRYPTPNVLIVQYIVLAVSTLLYLIQLIGVSSKEWESINVAHIANSNAALSISGMSIVGDLNLLKLFIFLINEEEYLFECVCLGLGWACIFLYPGIAALRCFRVFRLLWYYEVRVIRVDTLRYLNPVFGKHFVHRVFQVLKFAVKAISALIDEMVRIGHRTRGGIILILMLFYTAYVIAIALWVETKGANENCLDIGSCIFVLMRLTFFDGSGFDFAYFLTGSHRGLFFLVMFYMLLTSFGILNGLVGIFGNVFANASEDAFNTEQEEDYDEADEAAARVGRHGNDENEDIGSGKDLNADSREVGDRDDFDALESNRRTAAIKALRKDSDDSLGGDQVMPFTSDMSLKYHPSTGGHAYKVAPEGGAGRSDSPTRGEGVTAKPAKQPTISELMEILEARKTVKRGGAAAAGKDNASMYISSDQPSPSMKGVSSKLNMFAVGKGRSIRGGAMAGEELSAMQTELQQLRADMRAMMQMQMALQMQLTKVLGDKDGNGSKGQPK